MTACAVVERTRNRGDAAFAPAWMLVLALRFSPGKVETEPNRSYIGLIQRLNMFSLRKTTTYALIGLAHMANRPGDCVSAREIAVAHKLPQPLLMKVLKVLHGA